MREEKRNQKELEPGLNFVELQVAEMLCILHKCMSSIDNCVLIITKVQPAKK